MGTVYSYSKFDANAKILFAWAGDLQLTAATMPAEITVRIPWKNSPVTFFLSETKTNEKTGETVWTFSPHLNSNVTVQISDQF